MNHALLTLASTNNTTSYYTSAKEERGEAYIANDIDEDNPSRHYKKDCNGGS
jgi:hypothetical protein